MYYVYILFSKKDNRTYIGYSADIKKRLSEHKKGLVEATKNRRPLILVHLECFINRKDAKSEEVFLKSGKGRERLMYLLKNTFNNINTG